MRQYKDSGVEWIGKIPETWEYKRFKYSGVFEKGKLPDSSNIDKIGLPIIGASEMLGKDARTYTSDSSVPQCKESDILILWDGANAGITASGLNGVVSSTAVKYTCLDKCILPKYAAYLLKYAEHYFKEKVNGTTIPHMNMAYINDIPLLCPQIVDQQRIADYLDEKCGDIDSLIGLQEQMIEKLKAYKQSVITEAVTKGLDHNAKLVSSGIDWIGEIPEAWSKDKVIRCFSIIGSGTTPKSTDDNLFKGDINWLQSGDINGGDLFEASKHISKETLSSYSALSVYQAPFIIIAMYGASVGNISISHIDACVNQACCVMSGCKLDFNYAFYALKSAKPYLIYRAEGGGQPNISQDKIKTLWIPIPPLTEQQGIASYLDEKCADIDRLIALKQLKIESLKDNKKSVIYEAVTGKTIIE